LILKTIFNIIQQMLRAKKLFLPSALLFGLAGCGTTSGESDSDSDTGEAPYDEALASEVIENYADVVHKTYVDSLAEATTLKSAVDSFLASPSQSTFDAAKQAWLDSRDPYGQTEVFRFYGGPIDVEPGGPEGQLNAWPMDEAYVDYVEGDLQAGLINDPATHPDITAQILADMNGVGGEQNVSTGYHAIEFLLWGQDLSPDAPGARPFTDYVDNSSTASNHDRRGTYLQVTTDLVVADLEGLVESWKPGADARLSFTNQATEQALTNILLGMGSLSGAELAGERMTVAFDTQDQEDEHSCFSDNTHRDILNNALGIQNVYLGSYGDVSGRGLTDLVSTLDPDLDAKMRTALTDSVAAISAIPAPFDQAIIHNRGEVQAAIDALRVQTKVIVEVATLLGLTLNLEQ